MKTSKTIRKPETKSKATASANIKKDIQDKSFPSEEDIREKANEIWLQRIERGEDGTPENDWIEAENYFDDQEG